MGSGYISMPYFRPFLRSIILKCTDPNFTKFYGHQKAEIGPVPGKTESFLHFLVWSWYISMPHFCPFLPCIFLRMLANLTGQMDRWTSGYMEGSWPTLYLLLTLLAQTITYCWHYGHHEFVQNNKIFTVQSKASICSLLKPQATPKIIFYHLLPQYLCQPWSLYDTFSVAYFMVHPDTSRGHGACKTLALQCCGKSHMCSHKLDVEVYVQYDLHSCMITPTVDAFDEVMANYSVVSNP